ncbi:hypothetical protein [Sulfurimonas sediminis]|uniref:hypothetical protein n=1 Tax=Sulfurimonas sediminis TaxID=2590020 RepID=UPI001866FD61|nr:hypothetical protein [Sulfurimonas sediminis]
MRAESGREVVTVGTKVPIPKKLHRLICKDTGIGTLVPTGVIFVSLALLRSKLVL